MRPDYAHDKTPPLAPSESRQLWIDLIFNVSMGGPAESRTKSTISAQSFDSTRQP